MRNLCAIQVDVDSLVSLLRFYNYGVNDEDYEASRILLLKSIPRFLDLFKKYGVKATFFISGNDFSNNIQAADIVKEIHSRGHEVASHSYNHDYNLLDLDENSIEEDIDKNYCFIENMTVCKPV